MRQPGPSRTGARRGNAQSFWAQPSVQSGALHDYFRGGAAGRGLCVGAMTRPCNLLIIALALILRTFAPAAASGSTVLHAVLCGEFVDGARVAIEIEIGRDAPAPDHACDTCCISGAPVLPAAAMPDAHRPAGFAFLAAPAPRLRVHAAPRSANPARGPPTV